MASQTPLSLWMQRFVLYLCKESSLEDFWTRHGGHNCPGWTLMHLIAEAESAIKKQEPEYPGFIKNPKDFLMGSDGSAQVGASPEEIIEQFNNTYSYLNQFVDAHVDRLEKEDIKDEFLKRYIPKEIDFHVHLLTTHLAMHATSLKQWKVAKEQSTASEK